MASPPRPELRLQYLRSLSFEAPGAPRAAAAASAPPRIEVRLDARVRRLGLEAGGAPLHELVLRVLLRALPAEAAPPPAAEPSNAPPPGGNGAAAPQAPPQGESSAPPQGAAGANERPPSSAPPQAAPQGPLFVAEAEYGGAFAPPPGMEPGEVERLLATEGARLLFPFARRALADVVQEGGFPPVLLAPPDFEALLAARGG